MSGVVRTLRVWPLGWDQKGPLSLDFYEMSGCPALKKLLISCFNLDQLQLALPNLDWLLPQLALEALALPYVFRICSRICAGWVVKQIMKGCRKASKVTQAHWFYTRTQVSEICFVSWLIPWTTNGVTNYSQRVCQMGQQGATPPTLITGVRKVRILYTPWNLQLQRHLQNQKTPSC